MSLTVRSAQDTDEDAVVALWRASDLGAGDKDPSVDFQFALSGASSEVLVGVDEAGQVKASVMVGHDGHRGWLYYVAADPNARGRGLGRQIVQAAEEWLSDRGVTKAQLLVLTTNQTVVDFYDRLGFSVPPRIAEHRGNDRTPLVDRVPPRSIATALLSRVSAPSGCQVWQADGEMIAEQRDGFQGHVACAMDCPLIDLLQQ